MSNLIHINDDLVCRPENACKLSVKDTDQVATILLAKARDGLALGESPKWLDLLRVLAVWHKFGVLLQNASG